MKMSTVNFAMNLFILFCTYYSEENELSSLYTRLIIANENLM